MLKKIAAVGLSAVLALSPLAALAQTDQSAPAAGAPAAGAPAADNTMAPKKKTHHTKKHMSSKSHKMKAPAEAPAGGAAPAANPQ